MAKSVFRRPHKRRAISWPLLEALVCLVSLSGVSSAHALAFGPVRVLSATGQPLRLEVDLLDVRETPVSARALPTSEERDRFFDKPLGYDVKTEIKRQPDGRYILRLTSSQPIAQPALKFALEVDDGEGVLARDFSVRLGAAETATRAPAPAPEPAQTRAAPPHAGTASRFGIAGSTRDDGTVARCPSAFTHTLGGPRGPDHGRGGTGTGGSRTAIVPRRPGVFPFPTGSGRQCAAGRRTRTRAPVRELGGCRRIFRRCTGRRRRARTWPLPVGQRARRVRSAAETAPVGARHGARAARQCTDAGQARPRLAGTSRRSGQPSPAVLGIDLLLRRHRKRRYRCPNPHDRTRRARHPASVSPTGGPGLTKAGGQRRAARDR